MDGRKFDWIRQQLGLSKVELAKELGVSRQSVYRYIWAGPPRLVGLAMLGLWYQDRAWGDCWKSRPRRIESPRESRSEKRGGKPNLVKSAQNSCCKCNIKIHIGTVPLSDKLQPSMKTNVVMTPQDVCPQTTSEGQFSGPEPQRHGPIFNNWSKTWKQPFNRRIFIAYITRP